MNDSSKNKQALTGELESLKRRIRELEQTEARWKQVEAALIKSEETFRNLIENAPDAIYVHADARFLYLNPMAATLFGIASADQLIGSPLMDRFHPSCHAMIQERLHLLYEGNMALPIIEQIYIRLDGSPVPVEAHAIPITYKHQKASLTFARDISQRKQAEEALRWSEDKYRQLFEAESDAIFLINNVTGSILEANSAASAMYGYSREELLARKNVDLSAEPEETQQVTHGTPVISDQIVTIPLRYHRKKDGTVFPVEITGRFFPWCDQPSHIAAIRDITNRKQAEKQLQDTLESLRKAVGTTIQVMVSAVETRDPYTSGHQVRSADLARAIAMEMGLPPEKIDGIRMAGSIHDIGKLSIPAEILSKPTKLSEIEFSLIREHARKGFEMLKDVESPWPLAEIVYQHHERMDGSGYPRNLKEKEILIEARILAVADVVEAMASYRPYRPGLGIDAALTEIEKNRGVAYDNAVADACLRLFREKGFKLEGA
jgi:PAS domain S-box-containing protein